MNTPTTNAKWERLCCSGQSWYQIAEEMKLDCRQLESELTEANEYADKLAAGLPDGMLPKDVEVLREANLGLAVELTAVTEQRDRLATERDWIYEKWEDMYNTVNANKCVCGSNLPDAVMDELLLFAKYRAKYLSKPTKP